MANISSIKLPDGNTYDIVDEKSGYITGVTSTDTPAADTIAEFDATAHMNSTDMSVQDVDDFVDGLNVSGSSILDMFYPVGSYYETSDSTFDPNIAWGGTWVLETEGQVHVSAGTGYTISGALTNTSDGGESTHILTPAETAIRQHAHNIDANDADAYMLTVPRNENAVSRRTIKQGTGSNLTNNYYGENAITRRASTGDTTTANGQAHNNMQPYVVVNRWHRTA